MVVASGGWGEMEWNDLRPDDCVLFLHGKGSLRFSLFVDTVGLFDLWREREIFIIV